MEGHFPLKQELPPGRVPAAMQNAVLSPAHLPHLPLAFLLEHPQEEQTHRPYKVGSSGPGKVWRLFCLEVHMTRADREKPRDTWSWCRLMSHWVSVLTHGSLVEVANFPNSISLSPTPPPTIPHLVKDLRRPQESFVPDSNLPVLLAWLFLKLERTSLSFAVACFGPHHTY